MTTASATCELGLSWAAVGQENAQLEARGGAASEGKADAAASTVFAAKTAEFREALSAILDVKVAFYDNGQVRVTSQYDPGTVFVFQPAPRDPATKDGGGGSSRNPGAARMQLVVQGEGVPQELPHLMRNWVEIEQSIPCFLTSVTLECYDKSKRDREMSEGLRGMPGRALWVVLRVFVVSRTTHNMLSLH